MSKKDDEFYCEVLVDVDAREVDQSFTYKIPAKFINRLDVGSIVLVPFGRRKVNGYVTGINSIPSTDKAKIKDIEDIIEEGPVFTPEQMELARWLSGYYLCTLISALQAIISPIIHGAGPKKIKGLYPAPGILDPVFGNRAPKKRLVWQVAVNRPGLSRRELALSAGVSESVVDSLLSAGLLHQRETIVRRDPYPIEKMPEPMDFTLTPEQASSLAEKFFCFLGLPEAVKQKSIYRPSHMHCPRENRF